MLNICDLFFKDRRIDEVIASFNKFIRSIIILNSYQFDYSALHTRVTLTHHILVNIDCVIGSRSGLVLFIAWSKSRSLCWHFSTFKFHNFSLISPWTRCIAYCFFIQKTNLKGLIILFTNFYRSCMLVGWLKFVISRTGLN